MIRRESFPTLTQINNNLADELPYSIRILLESAVRNCDNFQVTEKDVTNILNWKAIKGEEGNNEDVEVAFKPARVCGVCLYTL